MTDSEKYADKIAKLLRKAEDPAATQEESEAFIQKAQQLMTQYAISEDLVAQARGESLRQHEEIVEERVFYSGIFNDALFDIGAAAATANDCKAMYSKVDKSRAAFHMDLTGGKAGTIMYIVGFESDVRRAIMLDASLQIQATAAMTRWARGADFPSWATRSEIYRARRDFLFGFAGGVSTKLRAAKVAGEKAAAEEEADRSARTQEEAAESVALVVRGKRERVNDWVDQQYGKLRSVSRNYSGGGYGGRAAGHAAGQRADTGGGKVSGTMRELGR